MARTIFDKLHLSSAIDGDWRIHSLQGLSRLSPSLYFGSTQLEQVTVSGYYNCPDLAEFRVAVREIRPGELLYIYNIAGHPESWHGGRLPAREELLKSGLPTLNSIKATIIKVQRKTGK